jgi:hypothetical protein
MIFLMGVYRLLLKCEEMSIRAGSGVISEAAKKSSSHMETLRFGAEFGRLANESQRQWFFEQKELYQMPDRDARFLAWIGILWVRNKTVQFSKWIWIGGVIMMLPVLVLALFAVASCFCCQLEPIEKTKIVLVYILASSTTFVFYKTRSFDAYRIGLKYFAP